MKKLVKIASLLAACGLLLAVAIGCSNSAGGDSPAPDNTGGTNGGGTTSGGGTGGGVNTYPAEVSNLVTDTSIEQAYIAPGWNELLDLAKNVGTLADYVTEVDGGYKLTLPATTERYQAQLMIKTDADVAKDAYVDFSFEITSDVALTNYMSKDNGGIVWVKDGMACDAGTTTVSLKGKATAPLEDMVVFFDFGTSPAANITIKNLNIKVVEPQKYTFTSLSASASASEVAPKGTVTLSAVDNNGWDVTSLATFAVASDDTTGSTIEGNVLTAGDTAGTVSVTATYNGKTATVSVAVAAPEDTVLYSSADGVNNLGAWGAWYEAPAVVDSTDATMTGLQFTFSATEGGLGGYEFASPVNYTSGSKLTMDVWLDKSVKIRAVASANFSGVTDENCAVNNAENDVAVTAATEGTYEKITVEIDLGNANSLKQLGFVSTAVGSVCYVDNIKIVMGE